MANNREARKHGGKRTGSGRPKKVNKVVKRMFCLTPEIDKALQQVPSGKRSEIVNMALDAWFEKEKE